MQERRKDYIDVSDRLARLEERQIVNSGILEKIDIKVDIQNGRVRKLEDWNNKTIGIMTVVIIISNFLGTALIKALIK